MIIRKYKLYNESNSTPTLEKFASDLLDVSRKFSNLPEDLWATSLAKTNRDPNTDLTLFKQRMIGKGWTKESITELFKIEDVTNYVESIDGRINSMNAIVDLYLIYCKTITNTEFEFEVGGSLPPLDMPEEASIRYSYGYHKTKYGKLINQLAFSSTLRYKQLSMENINILFSWSEVPYMSSVDVENIEEFIDININLLTIKLDMRKIYLEIQTGGYFENEEPEYEDFVQSWINYLQEIVDDYEYIKTDLILKV